METQPRECGDVGVTGGRSRKETAVDESRKNMAQTGQQDTRPTSIIE